MKRAVQITCLSLAVIFFLLLAYLEYKGLIWHNEILASVYPVKGLDISNHQEIIQWELIEKKYKFVFIKATEGSDFQDKYFERNWNEAQEKGLLTGAYHYFTTESSGLEQAKNFTTVVKKQQRMLPPVVDVEVNAKDKEKFQKELKDFISYIEKYYGQKPIIYTMRPYYNFFIQEKFDEYGLWMRDIIKYPVLKNDKKWKFWQYSNRGRVKGINGYVDLNCFNGSYEELKKL